MLEVRNLSKKFDDVQAVKSLSFTIKKGEVLGLIGPNGAGKTTALHCVCSILLPDAGTILINGKDVFSEPMEAKAGLAYVPEIPIPFETLTVWDHVSFTARVFNLKGWEKRAEKMIEDFDLTEKRDVMARNLSKGQKQKINLICAFIHDPTVIVLDEPLYGIDPKGGKVLKDLVRKARARGASIVISSHMLALVEELADRVLIMSRGEKIAEGSMEDIRRRAKLKTGSRLEDVYIEVTDAARSVKE